MGEGRSPLSPLKYHPWGKEWKLFFPQCYLQSMSFSHGCYLPLSSTWCDWIMDPQCYKHFDPGFETWNLQPCNLQLLREIVFLSMPLSLTYTFITLSGSRVSSGTLELFCLTSPASTGCDWAVYQVWIVTLGFLKHWPTPVHLFLSPHSLWFSSWLSKFLIDEIWGGENRKSFFPEVGLTKRYTKASRKCQWTPVKQREIASGWVKVRVILKDSPSAPVFALALFFWIPGQGPVNLQTERAIFQLGLV